MSSIARSGTVRPVRASAVPAGPLRLTRRGRLTVFLACLALASATLVMVAGTALGSGESGAPVPTRVVTVHPGDTLWGIADRAAPEQDPRDTIHRIRELNALDGGLQAGDKLHVPVEVGD